MEGTVRTTCPYCGVGCGVLATPQPDGTVHIAGDPEHPANFGKLCSKGAALGETLGLETRLLHPQVNGKRSSWEDALDLIADKFSTAIKEHGPDSVAFYLSGQILTEDYYVANKLMKGFIGSANIDTNSRLCMASSVAGHKRAFGSDTVPCSYEDLEQADLLVLVGSNLAWCHPVLHRRIEEARAKRPQMKLVVIDPRETASSEGADLHLAIKPDADTALFGGLLAYLAKNGALDTDYIQQHTVGFSEALEAAQAWGGEALKRATRLSHAELEVFYQLFANTEKSVTVYSQGVNQSSQGTDKVNAILNCHLATGRIGRAGMGPFSITGQPNAMGGREVGGLANMLAAHMELGNPEHHSIVERFWTAPKLAREPGLKAVELFDAVADGRIKALWIMGTNPADSLPNASKVEAAIASCPFVVVSEVAQQTDTSRHANVLLPSAAWGEKAGTVTNSERRISRQRAFLDLPGEAKPDYWQLTQVAQRMGFTAAFEYGSPSDVFCEHAKLSAFENNGKRDFDIGAYAELSEEAYDGLVPFQWPAPDGAKPDATHFFGNGGFFHADQKARFIAMQCASTSTSTSYDQEPLTQSDHLTLNTGRLRDQWHTMTRTGLSSRLCGHMPEPSLDISPVDAEALGLASGDIARGRSEHGEVLLRVVATSRQKAGTVFAPVHWTDQFSSNARIDKLVAAELDPISGQPAFKQSKVSVERYAGKAYGFAVTRQKPEVKGFDYAAAVPCAGGWRLEYAHDRQMQHAELQIALGLSGAKDVQWVQYTDSAGGRRAAAFEGDQLLAVFMETAQPVVLSRSHLIAVFERPRWEAADRLSVLSGWPSADQPAKGAIVCSCMNVGVYEIQKSIAEGAHCTNSIGAATGAGTNCGSCCSELSRILHDQSQLAAE
ncbi:nitrate reductase [Pseudovibrio japonicus]|nr:nitrate reductase [Pseudovibrio japonicus]